WRCPVESVPTGPTRTWLIRSTTRRASSSKIGFSRSTKRNGSNNRPSPSPARREVLGRRQVVSQETLDLPSGGSNPPAPTTFLDPHRVRMRLNHLPPEQGGGFAANSCGGLCSQNPRQLTSIAGPRRHVDLRPIEAPPGASGPIDEVVNRPWVFHFWGNSREETMTVKLATDRRLAAA